MIAHAEVKGFVNSNDKGVHQDSKDAIGAICFMLQPLEALALQSLLCMTMGISDIRFLDKHVDPSQDMFVNESESCEEKMKMTIIWNDYDEGCSGSHPLNEKE